MRATFLLAFLAAAAACSDSTTGLSSDAGTMPNGPCADDTACPLDQHCDDTSKRCVDGSGNACTRDGECAGGERCDVKTCASDRCHGNACVAVEACNTHGDCNGWMCVAGKCAAPPMPCAPDKSCPPGFACDEPSLTCLPTTTTATCTVDRQCEMGELCLKGHCAQGTACSMSASCPSGERCIGDFCRPACTSDQDCGGMRYRCDTTTGECQARCLGDGTCPMSFICTMNVCVDAECTEDADCGAANRRCAGEERGHGRCEEFTACGPMQPSCPPNQACAANGQCEELPRCVGDRGCDADEYCDDGHCQPAMGCASMSCPAGQDCVADRCVPGPCRGLDDCPGMGELCIGGVCQAPPPPSFVTEVRILTPAGVVRPGDRYAFLAVALDQAGAVVPGVSFAWASTSSAVASIAPSGVATGGARAGTTLITASVTVQGQGTVSSAPVSLTNLGPLAAGAGRVTVISAATAQPVAMATVAVRQGASERAGVTDASGVATISGLDDMAPIDVTVAEAGHDWVSVLGSGSHDLIVTLPPLTRPDRAGGVQGPVDLSAVQSTGALAYSVSGASFPSPLVGTDASALFGGELFTTHQSFAGRNVDIPIPAGSTASVELLGTPFDLKSTFYARARSGSRAVWSFGGKLEFSLMGGGGTSVGDILGAALPYFQRFDHDVRPTVRVLEIPTIADARDIDGDGDTTEEVPDWQRFATVPLRPHVAQSLRVQLVVDNARLPLVEDGNANALVVMSGALLPGVGFVPLGLDGLQDDNGSGLVPSFTTRIAPAHGGLEAGEYAVLALAFRTRQNGLPRPGSARMFTSATLPTSVDFTSGWLDAPRNVTLTRATRQLTLPANTPGTVVRLDVRAPSGGWQIWAPASGTQALPPAPVMGEPDRLAARTASVSVDAIELDGAVDPRALFDVSRGGALGVDHATRGYSRARVTVR